MTSCTIGVSFGKESSLYSFPNHPLNNSRVELFASSLTKIARANNVSIFEPKTANESDLLLFHEKHYVDYVKRSSKTGTGFLDYGDTPSFKGVYEAALYTVGSTLFGLELVLSHKRDHFFNPIGGLHHARRDRAGGFCVFNDAAIAIEKALRHYELSCVAYVDIDAHHGDGVYYGFENDKRVIIGDIHEDGRYLYPGTGFANENGKGEAKGTKLNLPLVPGSGDSEFKASFDKIESFLRQFGPEIIFFQCGADSLSGDPLTHLRYTDESHSYASKKLHALSHEICRGRLITMGGGGYNPINVDAAWSAVLNSLQSY